MVSYPSDWEVKKLGECGKFVSGNGFPLLYQGKSKGTYPFYKVSDLSNEGNEHYMFKANNYISHEIAKKLSCNIVPSNSVIFAKIGAAIFLERKRITTCNCCIDNNMMSFQPFQNISSSFICYIMQKLKFGDYVQTTALPSLSGKILGNELIPLPPLPEQRAIADTLSTFDTHIKNLSELIEKKKAIRDGALDDLMSGRTRLKGFSGKWEVKKIEELFDVFAGGDIKKEYFSHTKTSEHSYEVFSNSIENRGLYGYTSNALYPANSLTVSARGTIGQAFFRDKDFDAIIRLLVLIPKNSNINTKFCEYYINNQVVFENESTGVAQLTAPKIKEKNISFPPLPEQQAIADTLTALDNEIKALEAERDKIIQVRDGAMNDLLTGKVRLIHGN